MLVFGILIVSIMANAAEITVDISPLSDSYHIGDTVGLKIAINNHSNMPEP